MTHRQKLSYPLGLLKKLRNKAMDIFKKSSEERITTNEEYLVVPYIKEVEAVTRVLCDTGMRIVYASRQKLQDLVSARMSDDIRRESVVYSIPYGSCSAVYYGETAQGMERRLKKNRSNL